MSQLSNLVLGVDAGGTKTLAMLAAVGNHSAACILGVGRAGPGNPTISGVAAAAEAVRQAVGAALENAGLSGSPVRAAVVAQAGAASTAVREQSQHLIQDMRLAERVEVTPDYAPVINAIETAGPRAAVIAGTGSVAFFVDSTGVVTRSGGWGHLLGDEGSGYAIGRRVLREALTEGESSASPAPFTELVVKALGVESADAIIPAFYQSTDPRRRAASLAHPLIQAAAANAAMQSLLRAEMAELAGVIARGWTAAGCSESTPMVLAGGVLTGSRLARRLLLDELEQLARRPQQVLLLPEPATGCVRLARLLAEKD